VPEQTISAQGPPTSRGLELGRSRRRFWPQLRKHSVILTVAGVLAAAIAFVVISGMRPSYDAYGWLVWGRQVLHWNLDTNGAPSWKPLTFLFTLPYALLGSAQMWLWMVTAVFGGLLGSVFAARIAYRLTGPSENRRWAPYAAGAFAGLGVLGTQGYWQQVIIANSDPMIISLCLGAIDATLSRRPGLALGALWLASLGRPEVWPFLLGYAIWIWFRVPSLRVWAVASLVSIPVMWFTVPILTSKSWTHPGDLALHQKTVIHGNKITGVFSRWIDLYEWPMQIAALVGVVWAAIRRDRGPLILLGLALLWVVIEIGFALHGWSAVPRYLMEPAAITVILAATAVGRALAAPPGAPALYTWGGPVAVVLLLVALVQPAHHRLTLTHQEITVNAHSGVRSDRLRELIRRDGGADHIKSCGQPVTTVAFQSLLAYEIGLNVGNVGFKPGRAIDKGTPIVYFQPHLLGWQVHPIHMLPSNRAECHKLRINSAYGTPP
jgi:hypothetical protein